MHRAIVAAGLGASLLSFLGLLAIGLFFAGVAESGVRGAGALIAVGGTIAFAAALFLAFARRGFFAGGARFVLGVAATLAAAMPIGVFAVAAFSFAGLPLGSRAPALDWAIFAVGTALAVGTAAVIALGYLRTREAPRLPRLAAGAGQEPRVTPV